MHSGFANLRSALPMNIKAHYPKSKIWAGAQADIDRVLTVWRECLEKSGGPFLFGGAPDMADAMYAPGVQPLPALRCDAGRRCRRLSPPHPGAADDGRMVRLGQDRADEVEELDVEF